MYLRITVTPGAKKELVQKLSDTKWLLSVKEPAVQNVANNRVRTLIAREFSVPSSDVRILTGHHSRIKIVVVDIT